MARKPTIKTSVNPELKMKAKLNAEQLGMSESAYAALAIDAEVNKFDHRKEERKACENAVKHLEDKVKAEEERDAAIEDLKQVASHLGVPDTAEHCKQRIDEVQNQLQTTQSNLANTNSIIKHYETRGFWARVFNRRPLK